MSFQYVDSLEYVLWKNITKVQNYIFKAYEAKVIKKFTTDDLAHCL